MASAAVWNFRPRAWNFPRAELPAFPCLWVNAVYLSSLTARRQPPTAGRFIFPILILHVCGRDRAHGGNRLEKSRGRQTSRHFKRILD